MADEDKDGPDDSAIKPVASLRSRFEQLGQQGETGKHAAAQAQPGQSQARSARSSRTSFDMPRREPSGLGISSVAHGSTNPAAIDSATATTRTMRAPPPLVTIDSPASPPRISRFPAGQQSPARMSQVFADGDQAPSPRNTAGVYSGFGGRRSPVLQVPSSPDRNQHTRLSMDLTRSPNGSDSAAARPPVNRAGKPRLPRSLSASNTPQLEASNLESLSDKAVSPFSTPPGSDDDASPAKEVLRNLPNDRRSRPGFPPSFASSFLAPLPSDVAPDDQPPQLPARTFERSPSLPNNVRDTNGSKHNSLYYDGSSESRGPIRHSARPHASGRSSPSKINRIPATTRTQSEGFQGKDAQTATVVGQTNGASGYSHHQPAHVLGKPPPPAVPAPRRSMDTRRSMDVRPSLDIDRPPVLPERPERAVAPVTTAVDDEAIPVSSSQGGASDYPDTSQSNRRPPKYKYRPWDMVTAYDTRILTVSGEFCCTGGFLTRVWNVKTGESLTTIEHGEGVKVIAMAWKPMKDVLTEGQRLWLGTSTGDLLELDIPTRQIVNSRPQAHGRAQVVSIFRHGSTLWSIDNAGQMLRWRPKSVDDVASLDDNMRRYRIPAATSIPIVVGNAVWLATGKEIRVLNLAAESDTDLNLHLRPIICEEAGEVTCAAKLSSQPNLVYFGHSDGKVSVYNQKGHKFVGVFNVSVYKVSALAGVGNLLWAGYNDGTIYVYDTTTAPWTVRKNWRAHAQPVCSIVADPSSIWKLDRFHVLTLGMDKVVRIWDGMLEQDWLGERMLKRDEEFCSFREVSATVFTWNAGASTPSHLRGDRRDDNAFRELMQGHDPPDLFIFGFQELVDLEDKKLTAKSFFKSSKKKKDSSESEKMSHQYRAWRDHLVRSLSELMPQDCPYTLLQTANLVGLFSCVFVKSALRPRVKQLQSAELKRGMGGLHGNKGAIMLRMVLDDSAICLVNCHLAAGQTQTMSRNNDIAAILESENLPDALGEAPDGFVGGGDGTMILDHEIVIVNGDLNYRIDAMTRDNVVRAVGEGNLSKLLERDQLLLSRQRNPAFRLRAFQEMGITFAPTYKYNVGTDEYDTSEKRRSPAWCDRVLFRGAGGRIRGVDYRRWEVRTSDHRPVTARFVLNVKRVDAERREAVWQQTQQELEAWRKGVKYKVKLDYIVNVLGFEQREAEQLLQR